MLKAPGIELCQNAFGVVNEQKNILFSSVHIYIYAYIYIYLFIVNVGIPKRFSQAVNGVGSVPFGSNSPSIGGWIV